MEVTRETLSSNTLFHFTSSPENLIDILERGFSPRYCIENFSMFDLADPDNNPSQLELAVPMICFCDIPLSKVKFHISLYGNYGIGLSKTWGIANGISPILYVDSTSETAKSIRDAMVYLSDKELSQNESDSPNNISNSSNNALPRLPILPSLPSSSDIALSRLYRLVGFIKPYSGRFWRNGDYIPNVRFYDEREWRFVPDIAPGQEGLFPWISKEDFLNQMRKAALNRVLLEKFPLKFVAEAIRYIIVKEEDHISDIIDTLSKKFGTSDPNTIKKLSSKVITLSQIIEDF